MNAEQWREEEEARREEIGLALRRARTTLNLSLRAVAARSGVSQPTLSRCENGKGSLHPGASIWSVARFFANIPKTERIVGPYLPTPTEAHEKLCRQLFGRSAREVATVGVFIALPPLRADRVEHILGGTDDTGEPTHQPPFPDREDIEVLVRDDFFFARSMEDLFEEAYIAARIRDYVEVPRDRHILFVGWDHSRAFDLFREQPPIASMVEGNDQRVGIAGTEEQLLISHGTHSCIVETSWRRFEDSPITSAIIGGGTALGTRAFGQHIRHEVGRHLLIDALGTPNGQHMAQVLQMRVLASGASPEVKNLACFVERRAGGIERLVKSASENPKGR